MKVIEGIVRWRYLLTVLDNLAAETLQLQKPQLTILIMPY
jgi:hypothetical protein